MTAVPATRRTAWAGACRCRPSVGRPTRAYPAIPTRTCSWWPVGRTWCRRRIRCPTRPSTGSSIGSPGSVRASRRPSLGSSGAAVPMAATRSGAPSTPWDQHRLGLDQAQRYLHRIRYCEHFVVEFEYADAVRLDAFSTYRSGFEVRTWRLCTRILTLHDVPAEFA